MELAVAGFEPGCLKLLVGGFEPAIVKIKVLKQLLSGSKLETVQFLDDNCNAAIIGRELANLLPLAL